METQKNWWATLISIGMVIYGAMAIWSLIGTYTIGRMDIIKLAAGLIVPLLIVVAGIISLLTDLMPQPQASSPGRFSLMFEPYTLAWRRLWGTKWLRRVYGGIAIIAMLGVIITSAISVSLMHAFMRTSAADPGAMSTFSERFVDVLMSGLPLWANGALYNMVPKIASSNWGVVLVLAVVVSLIWGIPRLARLGRQPEYSGKIGFFTACIVFVAIAGAFLAVRNYIEVSQLVNAMLHPQSSAAANTIAVARRGEPFMLGLVRVVISAIISAVLIGGILGSLVRSKNGEGVTKDTFLADSVRYFEPLGALYLTLGLIGMLSPVSILGVVLIYVPIAVAGQGLSFFASLGRCFSMWKSTTLSTILLIALGTFFYALYRGLVYTIPAMLPRASWWSLATAPVFVVAGVLVHAIILLAVWEFYTGQQTEPAPST